MDLTGDKNSDKAFDLLLADYRYLTESFWKNETTGETRVNLYITLTTAVLAALVTLVTKTHDVVKNSDFAFGIIVIVGVVALSMLFAFGFVTLCRMINRNNVTNGYKKDMDEIRQRVKDYYDRRETLENYMPHHSPPEKKCSENDLPDKKIKIRKFGGLAHTVAVINSFILSLIIGTAAIAKLWTPNSSATPNPPFEPLTALSYSFIWICITALFSFLIQYLYIRKQELKNKEKLDKSKPTHAGGIVFIREDGQPKYFLIQAKESKNQLVFPKGSIEEHESHGEAAIRKIKKETGVSTRIIQPVGSMEYTNQNGNEERVKMYLMESIPDCICTKAENSKNNFYGYKDAMEHLTCTESRILLGRANHILSAF